MTWLHLTTPDGPATLNFHQHAQVLGTLLQLAAHGIVAQVALNAVRGQTGEPGLLTTGTATPTGDSVTVTAHIRNGMVTICGVRVTPAMFRFRSRSEPGHLHTCTLCRGLTAAGDRVCSGCASTYSHWITQGDTCPKCREVRLVRRIHEGVV